MHSKIIWVDQCEFEVSWDKGIKQKYILAACANFGFRLAKLTDWIGLSRVETTITDRGLVNIRFKALKLNSRLIKND